MTVSKHTKQCLKTAIAALDREIKVNKDLHPATSSTSEHVASSSKKNERRRKKKDPVNIYQLVNEKARSDAQSEVKRNLLAIRVLRERSGSYIPDQDRAMLNEALRARLDPKYIEVLLEDYPNACESGGIVDHINHPIHFACSTHRAAVPVILRATPECASQLDDNGKTPLEIYIANNDMVDITAEEFAITVNTLCILNPKSVKASFMQRESIKQHVLINGLLPSHLKNTLNLESEQIFEACKER